MDTDGLRFIFSSVTLDFSFVTGEEKKMAEGFKTILYYHPGDTQ